MSNIIRFEIETGADYSKSEKIDLRDAFFDFIYGIDGDVVEDTEKLEIFEKGSESISDEVRKQVLSDALLNSRLKVNANMTLVDEDDKPIGHGTVWVQDTVAE